MSDRETLLALLERFGLEPLGQAEAQELPGEPGPQSVILRAGHGNVVGYGGFFIEFAFDGVGKFHEAGVWE